MASTLTFRFNIQISMRDGNLATLFPAYLTRAIQHIPRMRLDKTHAVACWSAEVTTAAMLLGSIKVQVAKGSVSLDVFEWHVIRGLLARYYLDVARDDEDLLRTFDAIRVAMDADLRYQSLMRHVQDYEKKARKIERIRRRHARDSRILNAHTQSHGNPIRALEAGGSL